MQAQSLDVGIQECHRGELPGRLGRPDLKKICRKRPLRRRRNFTPVNIFVKNTEKFSHSH